MLSCNAPALSRYARRVSVVRRSTWTDERLDDRMGVIDSTFDMLRDEMHGFRSDMREEMQGLRSEMREEMQGLRSDFNSLQTVLVQIGFGLVGVLLAAMVALIVALA